MLEDNLEEDWNYRKAIFRYGMPCVEDRKKLGTISEVDYKELCSYVGKEDKIPEELLLKHFRLVVESLKEKTGKGVDDYFMGQHNHKINSREGNYSYYPEAFCNLCISRDASVKKILGNNTYRVKTDEHNVAEVSGKYLLSKIDVGKKVRIHRGYIVKEIE